MQNKLMVLNPTTVGLWEERALSINSICNIV